MESLEACVTNVSNKNNLKQGNTERGKNRVKNKVMYIRNLKGNMIVGYSCIDNVITSISCLLTDLATSSGIGAHSALKTIKGGNKVKRC